MGFFMKDADVLVHSVLEQLNLRFAPAQRADGGLQAGGIAEMAEIQKEFSVFKKGRALHTSLRAMHLMPTNNAVKERFLTAMKALDDHPSNRNGEAGGEAVVNALLENFAAGKPLPVYFTSHDMQGKSPADSPVLITPGARPVHYLEVDYLVISIPMQSKEAALRARDQGAS